MNKPIWNGLTTLLVVTVIVETLLILVFVYFYAIGANIVAKESKCEATCGISEDCYSWIYDDTTGICLHYDKNTELIQTSIL